MSATTFPVTCLHDAPDPFNDPEFIAGYDEWLVELLQKREENEFVLAEAQLAREEGTVAA